MSFEELDREVKQELAAERWKRYLPGVIALCLIVLAGVGSYKGYQYYRQQQSLAAAELYYDATRTLLQDREAGLNALDQVVQNPSSLGYRTLAQFALVAEYVQSDDATPARAILLDLADNPKTLAEFVALATIQAAMIAGNAEENADLNNRLTPYLASDNDWRHLARVAAADLALAENNPNRAKEIFQTALEDEATPAEIRRRIDKVLTILE